MKNCARKALLLIFALVLSVCSAFAFAACGGGDNGGDKQEHVHEYGTEWKTDEKYHWKECACGAEINRSEHSDGGDGKCMVCRYQMRTVDEHKHSLYLVQASPASCTSEGNKAYYACSNGCGKWFEDADGKKEITDKTSVVIPKAHTLSLVPEQKGSCTEQGNVAYYTCSKCLRWFSDKDGKDEIKDSSSVLTPYAHKLIHIPAVAAGCDGDGNIEFWGCELCERAFRDEACTDEIYNINDTVIEGGHNFVCGFCTECNEPQPASQCFDFKEIKVWDWDGVIAYHAFSLTGRPETLVVPSEHEGKPVTTVSPYIFNYDRDIKTIVLPASITNIEGMTSNSRSTLTAIHYTGTLEEFYKIDNVNVITELGIPVYVEGENLQELAELEFDGATEVSRYAFVDTAFYKDESNWEGGTLYVGDVLLAVKGVKGKFTVKEGTRVIAKHAFDGCDGLTGAVIPDSVEYIGTGAFSRCPSLSGITLPFVGMTEVSGDYTFNYRFAHIFGTWQYDGGVITDANVFVSKENSQGENVGWGEIVGRYYLPEKLTSVTVTGTEIPESAFKKCSTLRTIKFPNATKIGENAFIDCNGLFEMRIPATVTEVDGNLFSGDGKVLVIYCEAQSRPSSWSTDWNYYKKPVVWNCDKNDTASDGYIYVYYGVRQRAAIKDGKAVIVPQAYTEGDVVVPSSVNYLGKEYPVTEIRSNAFGSGATSLTIPAGITTVGSSILGYWKNPIPIYCEDAEKPDGWSVLFHNNHPVIWNYKNNDVADDGNVYIRDGGVLYALKDGTLSMTKQRRSLEGAVTIASSVTYKGVEYAVTEIPSEAFEYGKMTSLTIPASVTSIGSSAFYLSALKEITYGGTKAEWEAIEKGNLWYLGITDCVVHCTDGDIKI